MAFPVQNTIKNTPLRPHPDNKHTLLGEIISVGGGGCSPTELRLLMQPLLWQKAASKEDIASKKTAASKKDETTLERELNPEGGGLEQDESRERERERERVRERERESEIGGYV